MRGNCKTLTAFTAFALLLSPVFVLADASDATIYEIQQGTYSNFTWVVIDSVVVTGIADIGFWVEEPGAGPFSGIYVNRGETPPVQRGDFVTLAGYYLEDSGLSMITAASGVGGYVVVLANGYAEPAAEPVVVGDINTGSPTAEQWEGCLVTLDSLVCIDMQTNYWLAVELDGDSPGETLQVDQTGTYTLPSVDDSLIVLTGLVNYLSGKFLLVPRDNYDVIMPDEISPTTITDFAASTGELNGEVHFSWTATGDDGSAGVASRYIIRYSSSLIDDGNWGSATDVDGEPFPQTSGSPENWTGTNLPAGETFYFAIRAADEWDNESGTSNNSFATVSELDHPMLKGPYLIYTGVASEMQVLWQLMITETCTIQWGDDESYSSGSAVTNEYGPKHQHTRIITGLNPGMKYYYRVMAKSDTLTGSFLAAPDPASDTLKFLAYGDTRTYPADHNVVAEAMVGTYETDPDYQTLVIAVGDLVADGDVEEDWQAEFFDPAFTNIHNLLASAGFQSCKGNHEESGVLFADYFPYPYENAFYWSFDYGPAHFAVVDQYTDYSPGSAQLDWLEADLATTDKSWKFIVLHEPGWSSGGTHDNEPDVQNYIQPLCVEYGISILFAGHNHYYARAETEGIVHITTGGGGAPLRQPESGYPNVQVVCVEHHFCKIEINEDLLTFTVVTPSDSVIDSISLNTPTTVAQGTGIELPPSIVLYPPAPNPFNPASTISYSIEKPGLVEIDVLDIRGRRTAKLESAWKEEGLHTIIWDGTTDRSRPAGSGTYFIRLRSGDAVAHRRVTLIR